MKIQAEKIAQVGEILNELSVDAWLVFARESQVMEDPAMALVVGFNVVWQSFFIYTRDGKAIALVGNHDQDDFERCGWFTEVKTYTENPRAAFLEILNRTNPDKIAINYSRDDFLADGLTHGMYLMLQRYLKGTSHSNKLVSSDKILQRLRGRKTKTELEALTLAAAATIRAWQEAISSLNVGLTEKEVAENIAASIRKQGGTVSFPATVNAGSKTRPGHGSPTDARLEPGDLLHVDFGTRLNGYCSDLQRLVYFKKGDEDRPPSDLIRAFNTVRDIITFSSEKAVPGAVGAEIDAAARKILTDNGFPEYQHALGHQLGRNVHDGGAIIGPRWERYGDTPDIPLESGNVFTLELGISLPEIGYVGLEEDVVISDNGPAQFLCERQMDLVIK